MTMYMYFFFVNFVFPIMSSDSFVSTSVVLFVVFLSDVHYPFWESVSQVPFFFQGWTSVR